MFMGRVGRKDDKVREWVQENANTSGVVWILFSDCWGNWQGEKYNPEICPDQECVGVIEFFHPKSK